MSNKFHLYGWLFSFNPYTDLWSSFKREHMGEAFSEYDSENVFKSKSIDTLRELIVKTNGDVNKIKALLNADSSALIEA